MHDRKISDLPQVTFPKEDDIVLPIYRDFHGIICKITLTDIVNYIKDTVSEDGEINMEVIDNEQSNLQGVRFYKN
jgi:hypothetical protein